jgi:hypothetical protein
VIQSFVTKLLSSSASTHETSIQELFASNKYSSIDFSEIENINISRTLLRFCIYQSDPLEHDDDIERFAPRVLFAMQNAASGL